MSALPREGELLHAELDKAVTAGRHAFENGYPEGIKAMRREPHDPAVYALFLKERYAFAGQIHPLAASGFNFRIGHFNHSAKRNDWTAVSRDIANLHLGSGNPNDLAVVLPHLERVCEGNGVKLYCAEHVGSVRWPYILDLGLLEHGILPLLSPGTTAFFTATKKNNNVVLALNSDKPFELSGNRAKTFQLVQEVVRHFNGKLTTRKRGTYTKMTVTLPHKIRVDGPYGG